MIAFVWWHNAMPQSNSGLEQYYSMDKYAVSISPIAWYQSSTSWYLESRYNYEAPNTISIYAGRTFEHKAALTYEFTPMIGILTGTLKGGSIAENATIGYKKLLLSIQSQYTFSVQDRCQNFMYSWVDLGYDLMNNFSGGISLQQTNMYQTKGDSQLGLFLKAEFGNWEFPLYLFNAKGNERSVVLGLNYTYR